MGKPISNYKFVEHYTMDSNCDPSTATVGVDYLIDNNPSPGQNPLNTLVLLALSQLPNGGYFKRLV